MVSGVNGNNFEKLKVIPFEIDAEVSEGLIELKKKLKKNTKSPFWNDQLTRDCVCDRLNQVFGSG